MRRILSLMLAVVLVISMIITVNAVNISDDIISENEIEEKIITTVNMDDASDTKYTQPEDFLYGDVDMDGVLTVKDATCLQKGLAGLEYITAVQRYLAEPEKGNVTVKNATAIQKHIAGLEVAVPLGEEFVMASQDEFSNQMYFIEDNTEIDRILVYPNNIEWEYTLEDFPEYEFEKIEVSLHKYDSYPEFNFIECILYISNPSKVNIENAIRALDYRANLDLRGVYMITYDYIE